MPVHPTCSDQLTGQHQELAGSGSDKTLCWHCLSCLKFRYNYWGTTPWALWGASLKFIMSKITSELNKRQGEIALNLGWETNYFAVSLPCPACVQDVLKSASKLVRKKYRNSTIKKSRRFPPRIHFLFLPSFLQGVGSTADDVPFKMSNTRQLNFP